MGTLVGDLERVKFTFKAVEVGWMHLLRKRTDEQKSQSYIKYIIMTHFVCSHEAIGIELQYKMGIVESII